MLVFELRHRKEASEKLASGIALWLFCLKASNPGWKSSKRSNQKIISVSIFTVFSSKMQNVKKSSQTSLHALTPSPLSKPIR
jgi:hypothetical protein